MKLEVGMYVRTKIGKIAKIINKYDNSGSLHKENFVWVLDDTSLLALHSQKVVKASNNIIDLIEVGDYVNGSKVNRIEKDYIVINEMWTGRELLINENIKSIVTKEAFKSAEYRVETN